MTIICLDEDIFTGLSTFGMDKIWVDVDDDGVVRRELGFNEQGILVHRFPGDGAYGQFGVFDLSKFVFSNPVGDINPDEFDRIWTGHEEVKSDKIR